MKNQFHVEVNVENIIGLEWVALVREAVVKTLIHESVEPKSEVSVLLSDDNMLRELNNAYMGKNETTDVLSFPAGDPMPGLERYLGDIAISIPTAKRQAEESDRPLTEELSLLTIHATLHLLGYDHATEKEKKDMWLIQDTILSQLDRILMEDR